jgi:hypothetical protein
VADFFALADSDSIGRSILRETVARDNRKYRHDHKNGFAHHRPPLHPPKSLIMVYRGARNAITIPLTVANLFPLGRPQDARRRAVKPKLILTSNSSGTLADPFDRLISPTLSLTLATSGW